MCSGSLTNYKTIELGIFQPKKYGVSGMKKYFMIVLFFISSVTFTNQTVKSQEVTDNTNNISKPYGPWEDEICTLCLEDGNYNLYSYLTDSLHWDDRLTNIYNDVLNEINPTISGGLYFGYSSMNSNPIIFNSQEINFFENFNGGKTYGINISLGITKYLYVVGGYSKLFNDDIKENIPYTYNSPGLLYQGVASEETNLDITSFSYGLGFKYELFGCIPHISYSICETNTLMYKHLMENTRTIMDNEVGSGFQISFGVEVPLHQHFSLDINVTSSNIETNQCSNINYVKYPTTKLNFLSTNIGINYTF